jgi:hypothetical protein
VDGLVKAIACDQRFQKNTIDKRLKEIGFTGASGMNIRCGVERQLLAQSGHARRFEPCPPLMTKRKSEASDGHRM